MRAAGQAAASGGGPGFFCGGPGFFCGGPDFYFFRRPEHSTGDPFSSPMRSLLLASVLCAAAATDPPLRPRVEDTEGIALGVDAPSPRFSWALPVAAARGEAQVAYQLVIADAVAGASAFDSGKVASNASQFVRADSTVAFAPDSAFAWAVRWWSSAAPDVPSAWLNATFTTGVGSGTSDTPWRGAE